MTIFIRFQISFIASTISSSEAREDVGDVAG